MPSYLESAIDIAREAGALLAHYFERRPAFEYKGDFDLVTEADRASEQLVIERLRSYFPSHDILGEESGLHDSSSDYRWYVDPLDGTTNFAHGFPQYAVTMGLEHQGELVCGVIFDVERREMFAAERGGGAFLNGRRIRVSQVKGLEESLMATGFPSRKRHASVNVHFFHQISMVTHGVRRPGSAALDLAYVACGRLDGFWEFSLNPWDIAAGVLLVREAGGTVTGMRGEALNLREPATLLADNTQIHAGLLELIGDVWAGRYRYPLPGVTG